jgi:hypothetical protein
MPASVPIDVGGTSLPPASISIDVLCSEPHPPPRILDQIRSTDVLSFADYQ